MVNLTTASLEPAPLSSGWKSGSLPTGFTPTILRHRLRKRKETTGREEATELAAAVATPRAGAQCRVTPERPKGREPRERAEAEAEARDTQQPPRGAPLRAGAGIASLPPSSRFGQSENNPTPPEARPRLARAPDWTERRRRREGVGARDWSLVQFTSSACSFLCALSPFPRDSLGGWGRRGFKTYS